MRRFPWVLTLVVLPAIVVLIALGVWQMQRLAWKQDMIAKAEAVGGRPFDPATATVLNGGGLWSRPDGSGAPPPQEFERVVVDCDFQHAVFRRLELRSILQGAPGIRLISFCGGYLIDLGFISDDVVARPTEIHFRAPRLSGTYPKIVAQARRVPSPSAFSPPPTDALFFARDPQAMGKILAPGQAVEDMTLFAETSAFPQFSPLHPGAPPAAFSNNHLGYALTWFGLALGLVGVYVAMLRRARQKDLS